MLSSVKYLLLRTPVYTTHPMPLNMTDTGVTRAVGPAEQKKQHSYFQERKHGDHLGFADSVLIARTPQRVMAAFVLIWVGIFNWWTHSKASGALQSPHRVRGVCPTSHAQCEAHKRCSCASLCQSCTCHNWSLEVHLFQHPAHPRSALCCTEKSRIRGTAHIKLLLDFLLGNTP